MTHTLFAALVEAHTEDEARACPEAAGLPYLGVWVTPAPDPTAVHLFGEVEPARLRLAGWTPGDEAPSACRPEPHSAETGARVPTGTPRSSEAAETISGGSA